MTKDKFDQSDTSAEMNRYGTGSIIGGTFWTASGRRNQAFNAYYSRVYNEIINRMLEGENRASALDVGTSHGVWYSRLKKLGFKSVFGVEVDAERAEEARTLGYDEIYNSDAATISVPDSQFDCAISTDVLVHVLDIEHKAAIINEVMRVLKPGGVFAFNDTLAQAYGRTNSSIDPDVPYCFSISLHDFLNMVTNMENVRVESIQPSVFAWRVVRPGFIHRALRKFYWVPKFSRWLRMMDRISRSAASGGMENTDSMFVKLRKLK